MTYYLVSTDHLSDRIWFREDEDFKIGMNHVAVITANSPVNVLAFVLMSNHLHFVVTAKTPEDVTEYVNRIKHLYSQYYCRKYGVKEFLRRNRVDIRELPHDGGEALERGIAYVVMNPVAANICTHPSEYAWGSGACYYRSEKVPGTPLASLSGRKRIRLLKSELPPGPEYRLTPSGYILPDSFINIRFVQALYRTAGRYTFFIRTSSKARMRFDSGPNLLPSFRDQVLAAAITDICKTLFWKELSELSESEKARLAKELRHRFHSDPKQIARLIETTPAQVSYWLESY